jgi:hypothetical protein
MTVALMIPSLGITTLLLGLVAVALGAVAYVVIGRGAAA